MAKVQVGELAPDFELPDETGKMVSLASLRGAKVILYFYPADFTSGCTAQACGFRDNMEVIREKNGVVVGISPDSTQSHQKFRTEYKLPFILLSDPKNIVAKKYGAWGAKTTFGIIHRGIIRSHFIIDEKGKILDAQVKIRGKDSPGLAVEFLKE